MKKFDFWLKFVPKGPIDNSYSIDLDNGLAPNRRKAIIWSNAVPIHWHIYAALWGDELTPEQHLLSMLFRSF